RCIPQMGMGPAVSAAPFPAGHGQPLSTVRVPVIRHRGSNTLNFDFHDPETRGTAEQGKGSPSPASPPASDWYQTWPAKEAKAPSTSVPTSPTPGWSATWTKDSKRRERRWVKYDGIGPVDETGMPIASRSSVDRPRDWYRSMFRQIHRKLPGESRCHDTARRGTAPAHLLLHPHRAGLGHPSLPHSIFDYEPGKSSVLEQPWQVGTPSSPGTEGAGGHRGVCAPNQPLALPMPALLPAQVLLERELEQLSEELDKDMKAMETR
uniref:SoHo domain-containing protein n=1 Tax=Falco tinnunculus TaxID=100819 RepID=A0A8C4XMQ8_FALTI